MPRFLGAGLSQVSTDGGEQPRWGPKGQELFFWSRGEGKMMAVTVDTEPTFTPGRPEALFDLGEYSYNSGRNFDIAPDGQRFLMVKSSETSGGQIVVVHNWLEEVRRLVPTD